MFSDAKQQEVEKAEPSGRDISGLVSSTQQSPPVTSQVKLPTELLYTLCIAKRIQREEEAINQPQLTFNLWFSPQASFTSSQEFSHTRENVPSVAASGSSGYHPTQEITPGQWTRRTHATQSQQLLFHAPPGFSSSRLNEHFSPLEKESWHSFCFALVELVDGNRVKTAADHLWPLSAFYYYHDRCHKALFHLSCLLIEMEVKSSPHLSTRRQEHTLIRNEAQQKNMYKRIINYRYLANVQTKTFGFGFPILSFLRDFSEKIVRVGPRENTAGGKSVENSQRAGGHVDDCKQEKKHHFLHDPPPTCSYETPQNVP